MTSKPKQIVSAEQLRVAQCLIFGPYGIGKTHLLGTANEDERTAPLLILDFEGGTDTLVNSGVDIWSIRDWKDYNQAYEYLVNDDHDYRSLGIDSISETHIFALFQILDKEGSERSNPDLIQQGDYGIAAVQLRRLIREFRDLGLHIFMTALEKDDVDPRAGNVKMPLLSGRMATEIPGMVNIVGYLTQGKDEDTGENVRALILQNYPKIRAKVRAPKGLNVPNEIIDPTIGKILDAIGLNSAGGRSGVQKPSEKSDEPTKQKSAPASRRSAVSRTRRGRSRSKVPSQKEVDEFPELDDDESLD